MFPSYGIGLHLEANEMQVLLKWWLGLPVFPEAALCPTCLKGRNQVLDPLGHHALTCHSGPSVVRRHNELRDCLFRYCQLAHLAPQLEKGGNLGHDQKRPADILLPS